jgi:putative membrane protein
MSRFTIEDAERAGMRRHITWYTLLGLILVPLAVGGLLLWSLDNPGGRMDTVTAAVVNNDRPVTLEGQTVPLGRQLAAGLIGTPDQGSGGHRGSGAAGRQPGDNFTWVITDGSDAAAGLKDGRYAALVTIPKEFSSAATSTAKAPDARAATIEVEMAHQGGLLDSALVNAVTDTAARVFGQGITKKYLDNVYLGFNTLHEKLGHAHAGAVKIADGARTVQKNATSLADGADGISTGARKLGGGLARLGEGAASLAGGTAGLASGAGKLADGTETLASSLRRLHTRLAADQGLVGGVGRLADGSAGVEKGATGVASGVDSLEKGLAQMKTQACATAAPASSALCANATALATAAADVARGAAQTQAAAGQVASGAAALKGEAGALVGGVGQAASGAGTLSSAARGVASGTAGVANGAARLQAGIQGSDNAAVSLSTGAAEIASGMHSFARGVGSLTDGTTSVADGLGIAASSIPSYTKAERAGLAAAVTAPVAVTGAGSGFFSSSAIPLLAAIALWVGALALFVVLRARTRRALSSSWPTWRLLAHSAWPPLALGLAQGALVAGVAQLSLGLPTESWPAFAALAALSGVSFAALLQGVVAVMRGTGLFVAVIAGVIAIAAGIISTTPGLVRSIAGALPTGAATRAMLGPVAGTAADGGAIVGLVVWAFLGLALTGLALARSRTVHPRRLAAGLLATE